MTDYSALHIATLEALRDSYAAALKKDFDGARRLAMSAVNSCVRLSREYERIQDDYELTEQTADKC